MILHSLSDQEVYDVSLKETRPNQISYNEEEQKSQGVLWVEFTDHQDSESQVTNLAGTVCADGFDAQKTNHVCKLLGFHSGTWTWHMYPEGTHDP